MNARRLRWFMAAVVACVAGCSSSESPLPPELMDVVDLDSAALLSVGRQGTLYFTLPKEAGPQSRHLLVVADPQGESRRALVLDPRAWIRAIAPDGKGSVWVALHLDGRDQVWSFPEAASGKNALPNAKLTPELPARLNGLFCSRDGATLFALCGNRWIVEIGTDGQRVRALELAGRGSPVAGGMDGEGNLYVYRLGVGLVKFGPEGQPDPQWLEGEAAAVQMIRAVAVSEDGLVYVAAKRGTFWLSAYDGRGQLAFNVVDAKLSEMPTNLAMGPKGRLYALVGQRLLIFSH